MPTGSPPPNTGRRERESCDVRIRPRRESDIPTLVSLADAVRAIDRWPPHRTGPTKEFIAGSVPLAALVAEDDGELVGHVAVHERSAGIVMDLASDATGVEASGLAIVARLFVSALERARRRHDASPSLRRGNDCGRAASHP